MPIKKNPNTVNLFKQNEGEVLSYFTHSKRNHFISESKLYDDLKINIHPVHFNFTVHLTTYPFIAVHIACGNIELLKSKEKEIEDVVQKILERQLVRT